jgi:[ribosomal protein S5]-alanine N-acetyltransferase
MVDLRPLTVHDWPAVHDWARLPEACRHQAWGPNTPEQTQAFVRAAAARSAYAIVVGDRVVGSAELKPHPNRQGEISYLVHPVCWNRGIATAAARLLLTTGFDRHDMHRIFATCDPRNTGSARVLEKIGMTYEGRLRETIKLRDGWRDSAMYAILAHEYRARPELR